MIDLLQKFGTRSAVRIFHPPKNTEGEGKKESPFYLEKWTERTEKIWQGPLLQEGGLELERDDQQTDDDVRQGEVGDEEVGDGLKNL